MRGGPLLARGPPQSAGLRRLSSRFLGPHELVFPAVEFSIFRHISPAGGARAGTAGLEPAHDPVLETGALPVELHPSAKRNRPPGASRRAASLFPRDLRRLRRRLPEPAQHRLSERRYFTPASLVAGRPEFHFGSFRSQLVIKGKSLR